MTTTPIQDYINLSLRADTIVVNDTVKVQVAVHTTSNDKTEDRLRLDIKNALNKFIDSDEWIFQHITRSNDQAGLENIKVEAAIRIPEKENYKLEDRARVASQKGLAITNVRVDYSVPGPMLEAAQKELRVTLLDNALEELSNFKKITGRTYRLGQLTYQDDMDSLIASKSTLNRAYAMSAPPPPAGSEAGDSGGSLANSQKVSMTASVTFSVMV